MVRLCKPLGRLRNGPTMDLFFQPNMIKGLKSVRLVSFCLGAELAKNAVA